MQKMPIGRKLFYISFMSALTCTTISATYWQFNRYRQSKKRWDVIRTQLNKNQPEDLVSLIESSKGSCDQSQQIYPYRYVKFEASQIIDYQLLYRVRRPKRQRLGQLLFGPLLLDNDKLVIVQLGWVPESFKIQEKNTENIKKSNKKQYIGLIRASEKPGTYDQKQQGVHLHADALQIFNYFNRSKNLKQKANKQLSLTKFYIQLLRPLDSQNQQQNQIYPYRHRIDNFELPYLTPDKHLAYMSFWGLTTCVGLFGMFKVLVM